VAPVVVIAELDNPEGVPHDGEAVVKIPTGENALLPEAQTD
jgi:hypothetical protein